MHATRAYGLGRRGADDERRVTGRVNCRGGHLSNPSGPALAVDGIQIVGDLLLGDGFTATATGTAAPSGCGSCR